FCRNVLGHYTGRLGVSIDAFADTAGLDSTRLRAIAEGDGDSLSEGDVTNFVHFCEDLKNAEAAEMFDPKSHGLPVPKTIKDVAEEMNQSSFAERNFLTYAARQIDTTVVRGRSQAGRLIYGRYD